MCVFLPFRRLGESLEKLPAFSGGFDLIFNLIKNDFGALNEIRWTKGRRSAYTNLYVDVSDRQEHALSLSLSLSLSQLSYLLFGLSLTSSLVFLERTPGFLYLLIR